MQKAAFVVVWLLCVVPALALPMHVIQVVDQDTGRGVPLVELRTVNSIELFTDSNGIAVFDDPGLMNRKVFFFITSDGYEFPADGFKYRGVAIQTTAGKKTILKIKRINIAERLYRMTGEGIYGQTVRAGTLAGVGIPIEHPLLNADVVGQDSVQTITFDGKLYWFWGDTSRSEYPLGNFSTTGATSELPGHGGLDPSVGVNLHYWVDADGVNKKMVQGVRKGGPIWIDGLMRVKDLAGKNRLVACYVVVKSLTELLERGLVVWNPQTNQFGPLCRFKKDEVLHPSGQPIRIHQADGDWFYFPRPYAVVRVQANWSSIQDPKQYEAFTCLKPGTRYTNHHAQLDRDSAGKLIWAWKKDTGPVSQSDFAQLIKEKKAKPAENWYQMVDAKGTHLTMAAGTVCWNNYRKKCIMIAHQLKGKPSILGEVWYSESDHPWGPFTRAVKIETHEHYTFYNVVQHPQFDQDGGRLVYYEGTYTQTFSDAPQATPQYDYNQMMFRLDLSDPRLKWAEGK